MYCPGFTASAGTSGDSTAVAKVGETEYTDLHAALEAGKAAGTVVTLLKDVILEGTWTPVADFNGTFDGDGKTITGLSVSGTGNLGLFASIDTSATVKNLTISGATISGTGSNVGTLAGSVSGSTVTNVTVTGATVTSIGGQYTGGMFGTGYPAATYCTVTNSTITGYDQVGGLIGYLWVGHINNCTVTDNTIVATSERAGGIVGKIEVASGNLGNSTMRVNSNTVSGTVSAPDYVGGIAAQIMGNDARYEIKNNTINVTKAECNGVMNPIGNLRKDQNAAFTGALAANITGNSWTKATYAENSFTYTNVDSTVTAQTITNATPIADIYINNLSELKAFRDGVNSNYSAYAGKTILLTADIDLNNEEWTPINAGQGNQALYFDGGNHTISNLKVTGNNKNVGLFGTASCCTIKNLTIDGADVTGINHVAAIAGDGLCAHIINCTVKNATITTNVYNNDDGDKAGAICGYLSGESTAEVTDCTVDNCTIRGYRDIGGAVGYANGTAKVTGNTITNTTVINDQVNNYNNYTEDAKFDANKVVGEAASGATVSNNTAGDDVVVTIVSTDFYADAEGVYHITNLAGLKEFRDQANAGKLNGKNSGRSGHTKVVLDADIDLNNEEWTPIKMSCVDFDGQNHTIKNLKVTTEDKNVGFFGEASISYVENLTIDTATVTSINHVAAIAGDGLCGHFINCHVKNAVITANVKDNDDGDKAGAICGYLSGESDAEVTGCTVDNCTIRGYRDIGGAVGMANGTANVTGNTVTNTTVINDQENNYKKYETATEFDANQVVGETNANATVSGNTAGTDVVVVIANKKVVVDTDKKASVTEQTQTSAVSVDTTSSTETQNFANDTKTTQNTTVTGVKLTDVPTVENNTITGLQAVVDAAVKKTDSKIAEPIKTADTVNIEVKVNVKPTQYVAPAEETEGTVAFTLEPEATVTVGTGEDAKSETVEVTNEMINQAQNIEVKLYTGFEPSLIVHVADDGTKTSYTKADYASDSTFAYNADTGVATFYVHHFSDVLVYQDGKVASITKNNETKYYNTLAEAVEAAEDNTETEIDLIVNVDYGTSNVATALEIPSNKNIVLDLNGKSIKYTCTYSNNSQLIYNKGILNIKDTDGTGVILFTSTGPDSNYGYGTNTILNRGILTISGGTIKNTTSGGASYAVDNQTLWYDSMSDIQFYLNGGTVECTSGDAAIRQSAGCYEKYKFNDNFVKNFVEISGGTVIGDIWIQNLEDDSHGSYTDLKIDGGTITGKVYATCTNTEHFTVSISGGKIGHLGRQTEITAFLSGIVSGGYFKDSPVDGFLAAGYEVADTPDGEEKQSGYVYTVVASKMVASVTIGDTSTNYTNLQAALETGKAVGSVVTLLDDVDLAGVEWTPVANFAGTFDGANKTITGLKVTGAGNLGLFASTNGATIKDLTISGAEVSGTAGDIGALSGTISNTTVSNVTVINSKVSSTAGEYVGAIAGHVYGNIVGCTATGNTISGAEQVGGIGGYLWCGSIKNCTANNTVTATADRAGGIVGKANTDNYYKILGNTVSGTVSVPDGKSSGGVVGQVMGDSSNYEIRNNTINVTGTANPIGSLRASQNEAFTAALAANITGNWWEDATLSADSFQYTDVASGVGAQTIYRGVAKIGDKAYKTIKAAIDAAEAGQMVTLIVDVELTEANQSKDSAIYIDKSLTLDLNGKTITVSAAQTADDMGEATAIVLNNASDPFEVTIKNGTIKTTNAANGIVARKNATLNLEALTVDQNGLSAAKAYRHAAVTATEGAVVNIKSGTYSAEYYALYNKANGGKITVADGTFTTKGQAAAITDYENGYPAAVRSDYATVSGNEITLNGGTFGVAAGKNGGAVDFGGASDNKLVINAGTFNGDVQSRYNAAAIYGGTFNATIFPTNGGHCGYYTLSGGTYVDDLSDMSKYTNSTIAAGYEAVKNEGTPETWTVQEAPRTINVSSTQELQDALDSAKKGDTIVVAAGTYDTVYLRNNGTDANRILENITVVAAENADVKIAQFTYERKTGKTLDIENLVIDGFTFNVANKTAVWFDYGGENSLRVNGLTIRNCAKTGDGKTVQSGENGYENHGFIGCYYDGASQSTTAFAGDTTLAAGYHNISVLNNTITNVVMPIRFSNNDAKSGLTVIGNTFTDCKDNLIQYSGSNNSGDIVVTGNTVNNIYGRMARIAGLAATSKVTVKDNKLVNPCVYDLGDAPYNGSKGDGTVFKVSGAAGFAVESSGNDWTTEEGAGTATWKAIGTAVCKLGEVNFASLRGAIAAANTAGSGTITMIADTSFVFDTASYATISAGVDIVIDINGKKVVSGSTCTGASQLIKNSGTLTIQDSAENSDGYLKYGADPVWIYDGTGSYTGSYASNLITNTGTVTIESGYLENLATDSYASYVVDNNSTSYDAVLNVNGGTLKGRVAIRQFANNTAKANTVNISAGNIEGIRNAVLMQNSPSNKSCPATLNVSGGTLKCTTSGKGVIQYWDCAYGTTNTSNLSVNVTGGYFNGDTVIELDPSSITDADLQKGINFSAGYFTSQLGINYLATGKVLENTPEGDIKSAGYIYTIADAPVAQIGTTQYKTLADAVAAIVNSDTKTGTIKMIDDCETTTITIPSECNITIDLNGKTIVGKDDTIAYITGSTKDDYYLRPVIDNLGLLTITDTSADQNGKIYNNGPVSVTVDESQNFSSNWIVVLNRGALDIEAGYLGDTNAALGSALMNYGSSVIVNGGHFTIGSKPNLDTSGWKTSSYTFINKVSNGTMTINKGEFYGQKQRGGINNNGTLIINKDVVMNIRCYYYLVYNGSSGNLTINGGSFAYDTTTTNAQDMPLYLSGIVNIKGGSFTHADSGKANKFASKCGDAKGITGGVFNWNPSLNVAAGYLARETTAAEKETYGVDYTYTVVPAVASITTGDATTYYQTLTDALAAAQTNDEIDLLADISLTAELDVSKAITLDLNDHDIAAGTYSIKVENGNLNITGSGNITGTPSKYKLIYLVGSTDSTAANYSNVTIGENVKVNCTNGYAVMLSANGNAGFGVNITVNGTVVGYYGALYINGTVSPTTGNVPVVTLGSTGKLIADSQSAAIFAAGYGIWNLAGDITAGTAIYAKTGVIKITDGTLTANGTKTEYSYQGSGYEITGDAIVIDNCGYPGGVAQVTISGGTFVSENGLQVGAYYGNTADKVADIYSTNAELTTTLGYCWSNTDVVGTYKLETAVASVTGGTTTTYYASLQAAFDAAKSGDTVTLLKNITLDTQVNILNALDDITFDGRNNTITLSFDDTASGHSGLYFGNSSQSKWCTGVKIKDVNIVTAENKYARFGIFLCGGTSSTLTNVSITGNYLYGLSLYGTHGATLTNCTVQNSNNEGAEANEGGAAIWTNVCSDYPLILVDSTVGIIGISKYTTANTLAAKIRIRGNSTVSAIHSYDDGEVSKNYKLCLGEGTATVKILNAAETEWLEPVAQIGDIVYATLEDAIEAATDGQTIKLLADITPADIVKVEGKTITIDLAGKTISREIENASKTVYGTASSQPVIWVGNGANLTVNDSVGGGVVKATGIYGTPINVGKYADGSSTDAVSTVTLNGGTYYGGYACSYIFYNGHLIVNDGVTIDSVTNSGNGAGIQLRNTGANVTINGGTITSKYAAVQGNGNKDAGPTTVTINGGTLNITEGAGLFIPQAGTVTITGGTITAPESGVAIKSGELNISGGTIICTGADTTPTSGNSNGVNASGAVIQIESNKDYAGSPEYSSSATYSDPVDINITGGTFTSTNGVVIYEYVVSGTTATSVNSISVTGGYFKSADGKAIVLLSEQLAGSGVGQEFISGGFYSVEPGEAYIVNGYCAVANADATYRYKVVVAETKIDTDIENKNIISDSKGTGSEEQVAAAKEEVLKDIADNFSQTASSDIQNQINSSSTVTKVWVKTGSGTETKEIELTSNDSTRIDIELKSVEIKVDTDTHATSGVIITTKSTSYDVSPVAVVTKTEGDKVTTEEFVITNEWLQENDITLKFTLPVPDTLPGDSVLVTHTKDDNSVETFTKQVLTDNDGNRYVEIEATSFSNYALSQQTEEGSVAKIVTDEKTYYYDSVQKAIDDAKSGDTVTVLQTPITEILTIATDDVVTLDLNGKQLTATRLTNNGILTIRDSSADVEGLVKANIINKGTVSIVSGQFRYEPENDWIAITSQVEKTGSYWKVTVDDTIVAVVDNEKYNDLQDAVDAAKDGGTVKLLNTISEAVVNVNTGYDVTIDLNGKTLSDDAYIANRGTLTLTGEGEVAGEIKTTGTTYIEDGSYAVTFSGAGTVQISGGKFTTEPTADQCAPGYGTYKTSDETYIWSVASAVFEIETATKAGDQTSIASVSGAGEYLAGETVTLTAYNTTGYIFKHWEFNGETVSSNAVYTFTATRSGKYTAVYDVDENAYFKLTVNAAKSEISVDGADATTEYGNVYNREIDINKTVKVTYVKAEGESFLYWATENGVILSRTEEYSFTMNANKTLVAYTTSNSKVGSTVVYTNGSGQVISSRYYSKSSETVSIAQPRVNPTAPGYTFSYWKFEVDNKTYVATDDNISNYLGTDGNSFIVISPKWDKIEGTIEVTIQYTGVVHEDEVSRVAASTVTGVWPSLEDTDDAKFDHWELGGQIVSYSSTYYVYSTVDITLTAVYSEDGAAEENIKPTVAVTSLTRDKRSDGKYQLICAFQTEVPSGYTMVEKGTVSSKIYADAKQLTIANADNDTIYRDVVSGTSSYSVFICNTSNSADVWNFRAYTTYKDKAGTEYTIYSDVFSGSYDTITGGMEEN